MNQFVATMPAAYARLYGASEVAEHAAIVSRRGARLVHAEQWQSAKGPLLCVVAEDRPGLLALVTDALLAQGMAIQSARAFCRVVGKDRDEAVDFLELRALGGPDDVAAQLDGGRAAGVRPVPERARSPTTWPSAPPAAAARRARTASRPRASTSSANRSPTAATCWWSMRPTPTACCTLSAARCTPRGMRIMACEIRTVGGRARDRFEVEPSAQRTLNDGELCDVQLAVLDALPSRR